MFTAPPGVPRSRLSAESARAEAEQIGGDLRVSLPVFLGLPP
jgi:hypothetical protein